MTRDSDDDALRWEGDDDPTLAPGWKTVGNPVEARAADGDRADGDRADDSADDGDHADDGRADEVTDGADGPAASVTSPQIGSVELVVLGVLGGVYLLYSVGWLIVATTPTPFPADPVAQFMYGLGRWFAVSAPALWFGTVLWLTASRRRARIAWLVAGAVLLIPIPFLLRG